MKIDVTPVFTRTGRSSAKVVVNVGGARSSKSYSIAQLLLLKLLNEKNKNMLILRKTLPSLRISTLKLFTGMLSEYGLYRYAVHNKTARTIKLRSCLMHYTGLDDPEKIKSTEWNYIWMEEANEFTWEDFITLKTRLSARSDDGKLNQMYLSLNPSDESGWIKKRLQDAVAEDCEFIYSSYKDNRFISEDYTKILTELKNVDETYYKVYTLGEWAVPKNVIYTNWEIADEPPHNYDEIIYGLDFGYNNPTCLLKLYIKDEEIYIEEMIYETKLTNSQLAEKMKKLKIKSNECIYADCAEPQRIKELSEYFNIYEADKNVNAGIDTLKSRKIKILRTAGNVLSEIKLYKWKEDRSGAILDSPVKFNDHAMDAMRYAVYSYYKMNKDLKMFVM
jgi:phage terminase large subunit